MAEEIIAEETKETGAPDASDSNGNEGNNNQSGTAKKEGGEGNNDGVPKGVKIDLFKLREKNRGVTEERDQLSQRVQQLEESLKKASESRSEPQADNSAEAIEQRVFAKLEERERGKKFTSDAIEAEQYLLTRSHFQDPAFARDVERLIDSDPDIREAAAVSPKAAVKAAYLAACEARGVAPDLTGQRRTEASRGAGGAPTPSISSAGGKKVWNKGEAGKYIDAAPGGPGSVEYRKRLEEVKQAHREGRVNS